MIRHFNRSYRNWDFVAPWLPIYIGDLRKYGGFLSHQGPIIQWIRPDVSVSTVGCKQPIRSWEIRTSQKMPLSRDKGKFIYETWEFTWIYHSKKWTSSKKQKRFQQNSWIGHEKKGIHPWNEGENMLKQEEQKNENCYIHKGFQQSTWVRQQKAGYWIPQNVCLVVREDMGKSWWIVGWNGISAVKPWLGAPRNSVHV